MGVTPRAGAGWKTLLMIGSVGLAGCGSTGLHFDDQLGSQQDGQRVDGGLDRADSGDREPMAGRRGGTAGRDAPPTAAGSGASPVGPGRFDGGTRDGGSADGGFADGGFADGGERADASVDGGGRDPGPPTVVCEGGTHRGDAFISTRADLERMRGCKRVTGDLYIGAMDLDDLEELESLEAVEGKLQIGDGWNVQPQRPWSLHGLENLRTVNTLELWGTGVTSLEPLANLEVVSTLNITQLDLLENLKGLGKAQWAVLTVSENDALTSLEGLFAPEDVVAVQIAQNAKLQSVSALRGLRNAETIVLTGLPALASLDGLQDVQQIRATLSLVQLAIADLTGLGALGASTEIDSNPMLRSLNGGGVNGTMQRLYLSNNPQIDSLVGLLGPIDSIAGLALVNLPKLTSLAGLEGLRTIEGLGLQTCDGLTSFAGLGGVTSIGSLAVLDSSAFSSLAGLDSLEEITLGLQLETLPALTSLAGMPKLQRLASLNVSNTNSLTSLQGLPPITNIGEIQLLGNLKLASLAGLESVSEVMGISILGNVALNNLAGLAGLKNAGRMHIAQNAQLATLAGLTVTSAEELQLESNPSLTALTGLEMLTQIRGAFVAVQNPTLSSFRALSALTQVGGFAVFENRRLPQCEVDWLANRLMVESSMGENGPPGTCPP